MTGSAELRARDGDHHRGHGGRGHSRIHPAQANHPGGGTSNSVRLPVALRIYVWWLLVVAVETGLYLAYSERDAPSHWFNHFFIGTTAALLVMSVIAWQRGRPVPYPLLWLFLGHLLAMFPDFLFSAGIAHAGWMDVFLGHNIIDFVPGGNVTLFLVFFAALGLYLAQTYRMAGGPAPEREGLSARTAPSTGASARL